MKQANKISIIVPVYKVEKYLDKCIESLVNQTYTNLEIILVDDGSPDNCPKKCDDWAKKDKRIKVIHKENGGVSTARNSGLDVATGNYIMFVDSDDYIDLNTCKELLELTEKENAEICMGGYVEFDENQNSFVSSKKKVNVQVFKENDVINLLFNKKVKIISAITCRLYSRCVFDDLRFEVGRHYEDEFMIHKVLSKAKTFVYVDKPFYYYLQRGGSLTTEMKDKDVKDLLDAFIERKEYLTKLYPSKENEWILHYISCMRNMYCRCKNIEIKKEIRRLFLNSYSEAKNKNWKDWLFKFSPVLYSLVFAIRKK